MEGMMEQLLTILSTSGAEVDRLTHMQAMLQELRGSPDFQARSMAAAPGGYPPQMAGAYPQQQERPEINAIREAMLAGNKMKAIQLYRSLYNVDLKTAMTAVDSL